MPTFPAKFGGFTGLDNVIVDFVPCTLIEISSLREISQIIYFLQESLGKMSLQTILQCYTTLENKMASFS